MAGEPGIVIELASPGAGVEQALDLAESVWGARPVTGPMMRALEFAGCYVSVARRPGDFDPIGMCAGFVGVHDHDGRQDLHLHSHLAAVRPDARGSGVGRALKRHQRDWCLARAITHVSWTFDPLVVENARFNLHHLGAVGDRYLVDLYGPMDDDINRGDASDRLLVRWDLLDPRTLDALASPLVTPDADELRSAGAVDALIIDDHGEPTPIAIDPGPAGAVRLVATPRSILDVRRTDPVLARRWREAVRHAMTAAFEAGLIATAITADGRYVLTEREQTR